MKGPSLDAIRKFKEQQEKKKKEEEEKKIKEKLSTLEFRASHGDRKAKQELKRIESIKEERNRAPELQQTNSNNKFSSAKSKTGHTNGNNHIQKSKNGLACNPKTSIKSKKVETNFEELMKLAKQNSNEIKKAPAQNLDKLDKLQQRDYKKKDEDIKKIYNKKPSSSSSSVEVNNLICDKKPKQDVKKLEFIKQIQQQQRNRAAEVKQSTSAIISKNAVNIKTGHTKQFQNDNHNNIVRQHGIYRPQLVKRSVSSNYMMNNYYDDDQDEEDDYEADDFVVDDEEEDAQDELRKTLKSVFRYDRRRCDLREEELDRQYRAIGRVSTFEDLEREERRASRLAAEEDARELQKEDERRRLKKIRLKNKS